METPPESPVAKARRFQLLSYALALVAIIVLALASLGSVMIASAIAESHGCVLNEGGTHPCVINGVDHGEALVTMFVLGWLMLITLPAGAIAFLLWLTVLLVHRTRWRRRRSAVAAGL